MSFIAKMLLICPWLHGLDSFFVEGFFQPLWKTLDLLGPKVTKLTLDHLRYQFSCPPEKVGTNE